MSLDEALAGKEIPAEIKNNLVLVGTQFVSFGGEALEGQLLVHTDVAGEVQQIFKKLLEMQFPIEQMIPVVAYEWDDDKSMAANNTSAFNYRVIAGTDRLSNHVAGNGAETGLTVKIGNTSRSRPKQHRRLSYSWRGR